MIAQAPRASRLAARVPAITSDTRQQHHPDHHPGTRQEPLANAEAMLERSTETHDRLAIENQSLTEAARKLERDVVKLNVEVKNLRVKLTCNEQTKGMNKEKFDDANTQTNSDTSIFQEEKRIIDYGNSMATRSINIILFSALLFILDYGLAFNKFGMFTFTLLCTFILAVRIYISFEDGSIELFDQSVLGVTNNLEVKRIVENKYVFIMKDNPIRVDPALISVVILFIAFFSPIAYLSR